MTGLIGLMAVEDAPPPSFSIPTAPAAHVEQALPAPHLYQRQHVHPEVRLCSLGSPGCFGAAQQSDPGQGPRHLELLQPKVDVLLQLLVTGKEQMGQAVGAKPKSEPHVPQHCHPTCRLAPPACCGVLDLAASSIQ